MIVSARNRYELSMAQSSVPNQSVIDRYTDKLMSDEVGARRFFGEGRFESAISTLYNYKESDVYRRVSALKAKGLSLFDKNEIRYRSDRASIQNASPIECRYLVQFDRVRRGISLGILDGYHNRHKSIYDFSEDEHWYNPDYQRVHQGMVNMDNEESFEYTQYFTNDELTADDHLTFEQQCDLHDTNRNAEAVMDLGYDPTSDSNEKI